MIGVTSTTSILSYISRLACPNTVCKLLDQLTEINDQRRAGRRSGMVSSDNEVRPSSNTVWYLRVMLKPCLRCNSVSSPSVLGELEAKGVHTSKRANIISPSKVAELHDGCFLIVFVVVVTADNVLPESH